MKSMYRQALRLGYRTISRSSRTAKLPHSVDTARCLPVRHARLLHPSSGHQEETAQSAEFDRDLELWSDRERDAADVRRGDIKDIYVNDLVATLEAHRATNLASIIRKLHTSIEVEPIFFKRPSALGTERDADSGDDNETSLLTRDGSKKVGPLQHWPARSFQYDKLGGCGVKAPYLQEYLPLTIGPTYPWQLGGNSIAGKLKWPWLVQLDDYDSNGLQRSVSRLCSKSSLGLTRDCVDSVKRSKRTKFI